MAKKNSITITDNRTGKSLELPLKEGTIGTPVVDIRSLYKSFGIFTFDPGFATTASCTSKITFIDGDKGILHYRGYPIEELAKHSNYLEVCYLLLYNQLPNKQQYNDFSDSITNHTMLHESLHHFYRGFRRDAHPMAVMVGVVGALSAFYHNALKIEDPEHREISAHRIIAKIPTIAAYSYKFSIGQPFMYPNNKLSYVDNFINMMFSVPADSYDINPVISDALEKMFILHADHEQNASTSTVRISGSSQANPFACISAGVASLWGAAHGGANEAVLNMLKTIGSASNISKFINKAKDKNDSFRLMGFGHRVYKNYDPRAKIIKKSCHKVLKDLNIDDPLLEIAMKLEEIALQDEYFIQRKLYPNVDFYSGIILKAIGIPVNMFTVIFALSRTVGWISQWKEMMDDKENFRISRPRQIYEGHTNREYIPLDMR